MSCNIVSLTRILVSEKYAMFPEKYTTFAESMQYSVKGCN